MNSVKPSIHTQPVEQHTIHALSISALTMSKDSLLAFWLIQRIFVLVCQSIGLLGTLAKDFLWLFFLCEMQLEEADAIRRSYVYVDELACSNDMTGEL